MHRDAQFSCLLLIRGRGFSCFVISQVCQYVQGYLRKQLTNAVWTDVVFIHNLCFNKTESHTNLFGFTFPSVSEAQHLSHCGVRVQGKKRATARKRGRDEEGERMRKSRL